MENITFGQCFKGAWRDGASAMTRRLLVTALVFTAFFVVFAIQTKFKIAVAEHGAAGHPPSVNLGLALANGLGSLLELLLMAGWYVHVIRLTLSNQQVPLRPRQSFMKACCRMVLLGLLLGLCLTVLTLLAFGAAFLVIRGVGLQRPVAELIFALGGLLCVCIAIFVVTRFALLFCHVAIGNRTQWRAAWRDTKGHFWSIWMTQVIVALPLWVVFGLGQVLLIRDLPARSGGLLFAGLVSVPLWTLIHLAVGSACSAWLYRRYADELLRIS